MSLDESYDLSLYNSMWVQAHLKWITPNPCPCSSESDTKLYTNFEFCKQKIHRHSKNVSIYKTKQLKMTIFFQEQST